MQEKYKHKLLEWCLPYCEEHQIFVVDIIISGVKFSIFVDTLNNITIQECARLNKFLQARIDESGEFPEIYTLDVSSPGMTNPLKLPIQYKKRLGKSLLIVQENDMELEAKLIEVNDDSIVLEQIIPKNKKTKEEEKTIQHYFKFNQIKKALIPINFKNNE